MSDRDDPPRARVIRVIDVPDGRASQALVAAPPATLIALRRRRRVRIAWSAAAGVALTVAAAAMTGIVVAIAVAAVSQAFIVIPRGRRRQRPPEPTDSTRVLRGASDACDQRDFDAASRALDAMLRYRPEYHDLPGVELMRARIALGRRDAVGALARVDAVLPRLGNATPLDLASAQLTRADALIWLGRHAEADAQLAEVLPEVATTRRPLARERKRLVREVARWRDRVDPRSP